jgi:hypothetical protein
MKFNAKVDPFEDFSQKLISTYSFIELIPNFTNTLYINKHIDCNKVGEVKAKRRKEYLPVDYVF